jgi:hypothetical protein
MKVIHVISLIVGLSAAALISACSQKEAEPVAVAEPAAEAMQTAAAEAPAALPRTMSAEGARVFFITPADGDTVSNPIIVEFGIEGMSVVPAGVNEAHSGHHHLLIDTEVPDLSLPIPADENHVHFGDGRTSTAVTLEPGQHTLQMLLGDHLHIPHDPALMSDKITITVE